jgi:hypothetical protein
MVFTGRQKWSEYSGLYQQWAKRIDIKKFTVLGGEAMTSPDYFDWLSGIHALWPNAEACLLTNGHYLKATDRRLYDFIAHDPTRRIMCIGLHNVERLGDMLDLVTHWMQGSVQIQRYPDNLREIHNFDHDWRNAYQAIRDPSWPDCETIDHWNSLPEDIQQECRDQHGFSPDIQKELQQEYLLTDSNGVRVRIEKEIFFHQNALIPNSDNQSFRLHDSDPVEAHNKCDMQRCHHFVRGKLYKCGVVALLPELDQQHHLTLSEKDRDLMQSYQAGTVDMPQHRLVQFVDHLKDPIAQCKFCPTQLINQKIAASHGNKIKFYRKKKHDIYDQAG